MSTTFQHLSELLAFIPILPYHSPTLTSQPVASRCSPFTGLCLCSVNRPPWVSLSCRASGSIWRPVLRDHWAQFSLEDRWASAEGSMSGPTPVEGGGGLTGYTIALLQLYTLQHTSLFKPVKETSNVCHVSEIFCELTVIG